jgi:hypothetical protein
VDSKDGINGHGCEYFYYILINILFSKRDGEKLRRICSVFFSFFLVGFRSLMGSDLWLVLCVACL